MASLKATIKVPNTSVDVPDKRWSIVILSNQDLALMAIYDVCTAVDWRLYTQTHSLTDKQQKLADKIRRQEQKIHNLNTETDRIKVKAIYCSCTKCGFSHKESWVSHRESWVSHELVFNDA